MKKLIIFLRPWGKYLFFFCLTVIVIVSSLPSLPTPKIDTGKFVIRLDYLFHFCEYGVLAFLAYLSAVRIDFVIKAKKYFLITLALLMFAAADEFHQKLIPGRSFNTRDILSNFSGIIAGLLFCIIIFRALASGFKIQKRS